MKLDVHSFSDLFTKFQFSWCFSSVFALISETLMPIISQIIIVVAVQIIGIIADYYRQKILKNNDDKAQNSFDKREDS